MIAGSPEPSNSEVFGEPAHTTQSAISREAGALSQQGRPNGGPEACWLWTGSQDGNGYGKMKVDGGICGRSHRLAYFLAHGVDPADKMVCHTCDNPPCCNPDHLWLGTNSDNQKDCELKGRRPKPPSDGERNGNAKLTMADLGKIRAILPFTNPGFRYFYSIKTMGCRYPWPVATYSLSGFRGFRPRRPHGTKRLESGGAGAMRYFFHIRDEGLLIPDDEGIECSSLGAAQHEAKASACDLARAGCSSISVSVEIADLAGNALGSVRVPYAPH
jgi:hypothetical protein